MYSRRSSSGGSLRILGGLLIVIAVVAVFFIFQIIQSARQDTQGPVPTPTGAVALSTTAPTVTAKPTTFRIISDRAGLSTEITELYFAVNADNWDLTHLGGLAGHLEGTPLMGMGGNYVLAGHVELKDGGRGPFSQIHTLKPGDGITIFGDQKPNPAVIQYIVTEVKKVQPNDFGVMRNHGYEELTLITCDDWDQRQQTYNSRVIVHARPSAAVARLTATAAASVTANRAPGQKTATPVAKTATPVKK